MSSSERPESECPSEIILIEGKDDLPMSLHPSAARYALPELLRREYTCNYRFFNLFF